MKIFGAIAALFGGGLLVYSMQMRDSAEYKRAQMSAMLSNGLLGGDTSSVDTLFYIAIIALIIGSVLFIAGFAKRT